MDKVKPSRGPEARIHIGEVATATGLSAKAIRLYERHGLIESPKRNEAGYRCYTEAQVATLRFIRQAKALGLRLGEVSEIMALRRSGARPCGAVRALLDRRIGEIDHAVADLHALRESLVAARRLQTDPAHSPEGICPIIESARRSA